MAVYYRPKTASNGGMLNLDNMWFDRTDPTLQTIQANAPDAGDALPTVSSVVQEYTEAMSPDPVTVVCSGTVAYIGDTPGVLMMDTAAGELASYGIRFKRVLLRHTASQTPSPGDPAYIDSTTMLITTDSGDGTQCGVYLPVEGDISTCLVTDPAGLPAGLYGLVSFSI